MTVPRRSVREGNKRRKFIQSRRQSRCSMGSKHLLTRMKFMLIRRRIGPMRVSQSKSTGRQQEWRFRMSRWMQQIKLLQLAHLLLLQLTSRRWVCQMVWCLRLRWKK